MSLSVSEIVALLELARGQHVFAYRSPWGHWRGRIMPIMWRVLLRLVAVMYVVASWQQSSRWGLMFGILAAAATLLLADHPPKVFSPQQAVRDGDIEALAEAATRDLGRSLGLHLREAADELAQAAEALRLAGKGQPALRAHLAGKKARERAGMVLGG